MSEEKERMRRRRNEGGRDIGGVKEGGSEGGSDRGRMRDRGGVREGGRDRGGMEA